MNRAKKLIGMGLGLALLVSTMGLAFAADGQTQASADTAKARFQGAEKLKGGQFQQRGAKFGGHGQNVNILEDLVKAGTITAEQQKAVQEAIRPVREAGKTTTGAAVTLKTKLDALVTAGTITPEQETAITKAFDAAKAKVQEEMDKKLAEGKFRGGEPGLKNNVLKDLVTAGTINAEQQKAVQEAIKPVKEAGKTTTGAAVALKTKLDALVTAGTITPAQETAIIKAFDDEKASVQAEKDKKLAELAAKKGITVDELKAQMEKQKTDKSAATRGKFKGGEAKQPK